MSETMSERKTNQQLIDQLNERAPEFIHLFKGKIIELDQDAASCTFEFQVGLEYCHSGDIIQGGFITFMMDATMTHAVFGARPDVVNVSTLEINTSFLEASRAGKFICKGRVRKAGRSIGFMAAELFDQSGLLTATATTTAKLILPR